MYKTKPEWAVQEGLGYGYSRLTYNATTLTCETLEVPPPPAPAVPSAVDTFTLSKPLGWTPLPPETQSATYAAIAPTPEPTPSYNDTEAASILFMLKALLLPEPVVEDLVKRYIPAGSESYEGIYNPAAYEWTPHQNWATVTTFLDVMKAMGPVMTSFNFYKYQREIMSPKGRYVFFFFFFFCLRYAFFLF